MGTNNIKDDIVEIDPLTDERWNSFVERHPFGWLHHHSGWKKVLEESFKHIKGHYMVLFEPNRKSIKAAVPLFEVRSWLIGNRLVSIPFATICDPLISTTGEINFLLEAVMELSDKLKTKYIEIRAFKSCSLINDNRLGFNSYYKHHYLNIENDPERLKKGFHRTCVRQRIARALNSNLSLQYGKSESDMEDFYHLYLITRKRLSLPPQPYLFFKNLRDTFEPKGMLKILLAKHQNQSVGGLLLYKYKDRVSAEFAVSDERFRDMSPNHLLFWEAIKSAYEEGYKIFDFGRTSPHNQALMDFKNRWGTQVIDLPKYFHSKEAGINSNGVEQTFKYRLIKSACSKAPDAIFQKIGNFCYRHMG